MIHLSGYVKLAEHEIQQLIVKRYGQHTYLEEAMISSQPEEVMKISQPDFCANATLSSRFYAPNIICPCI